MHITVKLFGPYAQAAGCGEVRVAVAGGPVTCAGLREALRETAPAIGPMLDAARFAVDQQLAGEADEVEPASEVALIGLVSGG